VNSFWNGESPESVGGVKITLRFPRFSPACKWGMSSTSSLILLMRA
jgi:hypothetical protein